MWEQWGMGIDWLPMIKNNTLKSNNEHQANILVYNKSCIFQAQMHDFHAINTQPICVI